VSKHHVPESKITHSEGCQLVLWAFEATQFGEVYNWCLTHSLDNTLKHVMFMQMALQT